jgi:hypothetical protein
VNRRSHREFIRQKRHGVVLDGWVGEGNPSALAKVQLINIPLDLLQTNILLHGYASLNRSLTVSGSYSTVEYAIF